MKNINRILLAFVIFVVAGCQSWFDVSPKSEVKQEQLFSDQIGFCDALTGVYTIMGRNSAYGGYMTMGFIEILSQTYSNVSQSYTPSMNYEYTDAEAERCISGIWASLYNAIANCNHLLYNIEEHGSVLSDNVRDMLIAESLALRALLHFDLLRAFAPSYLSGSQKQGVPYVDRVTNAPVSPSTVAAVLDKALAELEEARRLAKPIDPLVLDVEYSELDYTSADMLNDNGFWLYRKSRLNYYGMTALAARIYLYKGDKTKALECAREVISSGKFELITDDILREESSKISFNESMARHEYISSLYVYKIKEERSDNWFRGSSANCFISIPRKTEIFGSVGLDIDIRSKNFFVQPAGETNEFCNKYYTGTQIPLIKLSEIYLIAAESSGDISYLETLRMHRGYSSSPLPPETDLATALQDEYRREFISEGQLFFYYKRLNLSSIPYVVGTMSDSQYVLPLPDDEIEFGN